MKRILCWVSMITCLALSCSIGAQPNKERRSLDQLTVVQGYPCQKGYAWFYRDGRLSSCTLARDIAIGQIQAPAGSIVALATDGTLLRLLPAHPLTIGAAHCAGGGILGPGEGPVVVFYPSGKMNACYLVGDQMIDGVPCASGGILKATFSHEFAAEFFESGKLKSCGLAHDFRGQSKGTRFIAAL